LDKGNEKKKGNKLSSNFHSRAKTKTFTNEDPTLYIEGMDGNDTIFPTKVN